jgi:hypothetical protein
MEEETGIPHLYIFADIKVHEAMHNPQPNRKFYEERAIHGSGHRKKY